LYGKRFGMPGSFFRRERHCGFYALCELRSIYYKHVIVQFWRASSASAVLLRLLSQFCALIALAFASTLALPVFSLLLPYRHGNLLLPGFVIAAVSSAT